MAPSDRLDAAQHRTLFPFPYHPHTVHVACVSFTCKIPGNTNPSTTASIHAWRGEPTLVSSRRHRGATLCVYMGTTQAHCGHTFIQVRVHASWSYQDPHSHADNSIRRWHSDHGGFGITRSSSGPLAYADTYSGAKNAWAFVAVSLY